MTGDKWQVAGDRHQVSAVSPTVTLLLMVPTPRQKSDKKPTRGGRSKLALGDFAAQAYGESVQGPRNIRKHKLRAHSGPQTLENISSNETRGQ